MKALTPTTTPAGAPLRLAPALALVAAAVLVPTGLVLWFMFQAVENERFAVRQRLEQVYSQWLDDRIGEVTSFWESRAASLEEASLLPPPEAFRLIVTSRLATSAILYDDDGNVAYPRPQEPAKPESASPAWLDARRLEWQERRPEEAAEAYLSIAQESSGNDVETGRALMAAARCLANTGNKAEAISVLTGRLAEARFGAVRDASGRLIAPNAALRALELIDDPHDARFGATAHRLVERLNDYTGPQMSSEQRLFLMDASLPLVKQLPAFEHSDSHLPQPLWKEKASAMSEAFMDHSLPRDEFMAELGQGVTAPMPPVFATLAAEKLAQRYLAEALLPPDNKELEAIDVDPGHAGRERTNLDEINYRFATESKRVVALFDDRYMAHELLYRTQLGTAPYGTDVRFISPHGWSIHEQVIVTSDPLPGMPQWRAALVVMEGLRGEDPFRSAARQRIAIYLWVGLLGVAAIAAVALLTGRYLSRQMRLTRLKNDLVATVSHELRTPVASMRVLLDTLVDGRTTREGQREEYLAIIARENERLSRLIENFLAFSRMERNKHSFDFDQVDVSVVVERAVEAMGEKLKGPRCELAIDVPPDLPAVNADPNAILTVLINLLDNACKHTGDDKRITIRAQRRPDAVAISVSDNGPGIAPRDRKRIFKRFYQADRGLSEHRGGCGLGLAIAKFIIDAHGGSIEVESRMGQGATFTVTLPRTSSVGLRPLVPVPPLLAARTTSVSVKKG